MVSAHTKNHSVSITCVMIELTGNDIFAFLPMQDMLLFLVFNMSLAAILGYHLEFEGQDRPKIQ